MTIKEMLEQSAEKYRDETAYQMRQESGGYRKITFQQVAERARKIQGALAKLGIARGDRVALISENRPEWTISYLAVASMGAINVPLDAMQSREEILPLLEDSGAKAIILSRKYEEYAKGTRVEKKELFMEKIEGLSAESSAPKSEVKLDDVAAIVYTSGTTGIPKGVVLTHRNIMSNVMAVAALFDLGPGDNFLMALPLHHSFETTAGFLGPFYKGCTKTFPETLKSHAILQNLQETGVTVLGSVPLFYQLLYDGILREAEERGLKRVFSALFAVSKFFKYVLGFSLGKYLFSTLHKKFGGKIRFFITGGAAFDPELVKKFDLMGFITLQGYGLTESSPILAVETLKNRKVGSVGKPIAGVEIKIAGVDPVGEVLAFGPNIMKGYYKRRELTSKVVVNGWLHTGDVGYLDKEGYLFLTGRCKDIIVTASGVNVFPEEIEPMLNAIVAIKESCVMGAKVLAGVRKGTEEVFAVIVLDMEYFEKIGHKEDEFIKETISKEVEAFNHKIAAYKRIARFIIRKEKLPRTRLLKIKRFKVRKEYNLSG